MRLLLKIVLLSAVTLTSIVWLGCGGGTEVNEGFTVIGILYENDGGVAPGVNVEIMPYETTAFKMAKLKNGDGTIVEGSIVTQTDESGRILLDTAIYVADGFYYVYGVAGWLKSFEDSLEFENGICVDTLIDTLKYTGSISGVLKLLNGDDPISSSIYVYGPNVIYKPNDKLGNFRLGNLAEGTYRVLFDAKYGKYRALDTVITIQAGYNDTFPDTIVLPLRTVEVEIDTVIKDYYMQAATISWNRLVLDSTMFGGYEFSKNNVKQPLVNDTSITCYVNERLVARVCPILFNNDLNGSCSETREVIFYKTDVKSIDPEDPEKIIGIKTISVSADSSRALGFTLANNMFHILSVSRYNPSDVSINVVNRDGTREQTYSLPDNANVSPMAIAAKGDSIYLLDKKNDDTLCLRSVSFNDSIECALNITIPSNFGVGANLEFASSGLIYVSQYLTTYVINPEGDIITKKNGLSSNFALTESGLFTIVEGIGSDYSDDTYPHVGNIPLKKVVKFALGETGSLDSIGSFVYDKYNLLVDVIPSLFGANNSGTVCCLVDEQNLFIFHERGDFATRRIYLKEGTTVVDLLLTEDDILYLLHNRGRIDVIDLRGGTTAETP